MIFGKDTHCIGRARRGNLLKEIVDFLSFWGYEFKNFQSRRKMLCTHNFLDSFLSTFRENFIPRERVRERERRRRRRRRGRRRRRKRYLKRVLRENRLEREKPRISRTGSITPQWQLSFSLTLSYRICQLQR